MTAGAEHLAAGEAARGAGLSATRRVIGTAGLMLATTMHSLDSTIANVALPHIQGNLSASPEQITWVLTSYIVGTAVMTPFSGWLSYRIGRKPLLLISTLAFVGISMLCGMATTFPEIVAFRFLQGASGAALMPLSLAVLLDMWPLHVIPRVIATWSCAVMVAPIFGPTLGGYLTEHFSWRWVFYINLPAGLIGALGILLFLPRDKGSPDRHFDALGFGAIVLGSISLQLMLDRGPGQDWFYSREIWIEAVVAFCAFYVFAIHTATSRRPFFPAVLFRDRNYMSCLLFSLVAQSVMFCAIALQPIFMQTLMGYSAIQSGVAVTPRGVASLVAFALAPALAAWVGPRTTVAIGILCASLALWQMARFDLSMTAHPIHVSGVFLGLAQGFMLNPVSVMAFASLPMHMRTDGSVASNTFRTLGTSVSIAIVQAHMLGYNAQAHERLAGGVVASDPVVRAGLPPAFNGGPAALESLNAEVTRQASVMGYDTAHAWLSVIMLMMLPLLLLMRPVKLKGETLQEIHAD